MRDVAGGLGLHSAGTFQYIRPEIPGFILGSFIATYAFREFRARGGSSPIIRFVLGMFLMVGALTFVGCAFRVHVRMASGDLNAILLGLPGLITGVLVGVFFLKRGFTLSRATVLSTPTGWIFPLMMLGLLLLVITRPDFINFSTEGFGAQHAAIGISLGAGLVVGFLAQRTRLCFTGAYREIVLSRNTWVLTVVVSFIIAAVVFNILFGQFHLSWAGAPDGHSDHLWNFLGLFLVGLAAIELNGCPFRQMIWSGEGNTDAAITVLGMLVGGALMRGWNLAACGNTPPVGGMIAVGVGIAFCIAVGLYFKGK